LKEFVEMKGGKMAKQKERIQVSRLFERDAKSLAQLLFQAGYLKLSGISLKKLEEADPQKYAELLIESGYRDEAGRVFVSNPQSPRDYFQAAELAVRIGEYDAARRFIQKTRQQIARDKNYYASDGSIGSGIGACNTRMAAERLEKRVNELEGMMQRLT
jgi:hypothetical protein